MMCLDQLVISETTSARAKRGAAAGRLPLIVVLVVVVLADAEK